MKTIITTILLLFTVLVVGQSKEYSFDRVYLMAEEQQIKDDREVKTIVTIYDNTITVKDKSNIYIFEVIAKVKEEKDITVLLSNSVKQNNVKIVYDKDFTAISFNFTDRFVMFYDSNKIIKYSKKY